MVSRYSTEEGKFMPTDEFHAFVDVLRAHVRGAKVRKAGSRLKGVAIEGSDSDYHIVTPEEMTTMERDLILASLRNRGYLVSCKKAFTLKTARGASIDFLPQKAEWHENVSVQEPVKLDQGGQNAVSKLKASWPWVGSDRLEQIVLRLQQECGWNGKEDPGGLRRFQAAERRIRNAVYDDDIIINLYMFDDVYDDDCTWF